MTTKPGLPGPIALLGRAWGILSMAVILGASLAAVQLIPTGEYLVQSQRAAAVDYEYTVNYSFWPWHLITLIAPGMFGNPVSGDYWGYANYWEDAIYIGLLPLLLAMVASINALGQAVRRQRGTNPSGDNPFDDEFPASLPGFLVTVTLLGFLLALGKNTPVFPWLYRNIPTFDMFQAPARFMIWGVFSLALLAGLGAERWRRPQNRALYWTRLGAAGAFAVSFGAGLAWIVLGDVSPTIIRATALAGLWGLGAGVLSLLAPEEDNIPGNELRNRTETLWAWGVAFFVAADLLVAGWGLNPGVDLEIYEPYPFAAKVRESLAGQRLYLSQSDEETIKYKRFLRFDTFDPGVDWLDLRAAILPNINLLDGISSINNFDPLVPGRYADWIAALAEVEESTRRHMLAWMDVGAVEYVDEGSPRGVKFVFFEDGNRLHWIPCAEFVADGNQAWQRLVESDFNPDPWVILEGDPGLASPVDCPPSNVSDQQVGLSILSDKPGEVIVKVNSSVSGWLVLSDLWYPSWKTSVDGRPTRIFRANYLFRAVWIEAGERQVVFHYAPASFWSGLFVSLAAFVILILFYYWRNRILRLV